MMYHFVGYLIKNQNGDVVQYSPNRVVAEQFCQQNGLPLTGIVQVHEWKAIAFAEPTTPPPPTEPEELQPV